MAAFRVTKTSTMQKIISGVCTRVPGMSSPWHSGDPGSTT